MQTRREIEKDLAIAEWSARRAEVAAEFDAWLEPQRQAARPGIIAGLFADDENNTNEGNANV